MIAEYDNGAAVASPSREYIYSSAQLLAKIESGATTYYHADHLSARLLTDSSGNTLGQRGHYPFGETWYETGTTTKFKFTTYERDAESGNDYALARYSVNRLGRFSSPDPVAGSNGNPQLLDRYSYVTNDPTNLADPSGLCPSPAAAPIFFANHTACTSAAPSVAMQTLLVFGYSASVGSDSEGLFWSWGFGLLGAFTTNGPYDPGGGGDDSRKKGKSKTDKLISELCGAIRANGGGTVSFFGGNDAVTFDSNDF